ncbi:YqaA family protein [Emcibacter nanhaiensis]|uniref:DedA family protein n=1 Tax=Emcibacter nanhaiensis TaxID=1505037 RepID=A0A501PGL8_9PROT|nr:YqaA family protein [Emcibacter nanhaiensis]TPD59345.1 DedA family protein [Emcibacter nanhaiensis]
MFNKLYNKTLELAEKPHALSMLAIISFIESSFFPIPPDILLIPMVLAAPSRAWKIAFVCTISSVLGGLFGYYIGYALFDVIGQPLLEFYGHEENFARFTDQYNEWGAWIVAFFGLTPFPYKVITIASGVTHLSLPTFILASLVSRAVRFYLVAALLWKFGAPIKTFIEKRLGLLTTLFFIFLFGGFLALKYL